jgi:hypothetical protein
MIGGETPTLITRKRVVRQKVAYQKVASAKVAYQKVASAKVAYQKVASAKVASPKNEFKTDDILLELSHRISRGDTNDMHDNKINPDVPPEYITYEMLLKEHLYEEETITEEEIIELYNIYVVNEDKIELRDDDYICYGLLLLNF